MSIVAKAGAAFQRVLGQFAEEAAAEVGLIVRRRVLSATSLARAFVLGFLERSDASDRHLAQVAAQCGAPVTPQAIAHRHTPKLVDFLQALFRRATSLAVGSDKALAPLLERFPAVIAIDSTVVAVPDGMRGLFPGCGGSGGGGAAALKLQTELDLRTGALAHVAVERGRDPDSATPRQFARRPPGTLRIADLGYFALPVLAAIVAADGHFLSRPYFSTTVRTPQGGRLDLLAWLAGLAGPLVDESVLLGPQRLACRLVAWRLPPEAAGRRRQKLRKEMRHKHGAEPSDARLAWCDWTILVTSVPAGMLSAKEAVVLYRARWQVELLFKRWKSQDRVAMLEGSTEVRRMARVWARLLAAVLRQWLVAGCAWGEARVSWWKAGDAVRGFVGRLAAALDDPERLDAAIDLLGRVMAKTCRRDKRRNPGTADLLNDVNLLEYRLT